MRRGVHLPDRPHLEGTLVVDGTIAGVGIPAEPSAMQVEGGRLTAASGPEGAALLELLTAHGPEARPSRSSGSAPTSEPS